MEHISHDGNLYELINRDTPLAWDEHVGELIHSNGQHYLVHRVICVASTPCARRLAVALMKSVASILFTFRLSRLSAHWDGVWSGKTITYRAYEMEIGEERWFD